MVSGIIIGEYMKRMYDFICGECSHEFEKLTANKDNVECPNCGSLDTHVKLNTPALKVVGGYDRKMRV